MTTHHEKKTTIEEFETTLPEGMEQLELDFSRKREKVRRMRFTHEEKHLLYHAARYCIRHGIPYSVMARALSLVMPRHSIKSLQKKMSDFVPYRATSRKEILGR